MTDDNICSIRDCSKPGNGLCKCQFPPVPVCRDHIFTHMESEPLRDHSIIPIFDKLSKKESILLELAKNRAVSIKTQSILEISQEYSQKQSSLHKKFLSLLDEFNARMHPILLSLETAIVTNQTLRSASDNILIELKKGVDLDRQEQEEFINKVLLKAISNVPLRIKAMLNPEKETFCCYFERNSKSLIVINNKEMTKVNVFLKSLPENMGNVAGVCELEDNYMFHCGGYSGKYISKTYRFNMKTLTYDTLPTMPFKLCVLAPIRIQDTIFAFGGEGNVKKAALQYSIKEKRWIVMPNMPFHSINISCVAVNNSILLVGYNTNGVYEFKESTYKKIFNCGRGFNIILKNKLNEIFLLADGSIYKSDERDFTSWVIAGSYDVELMCFLNTSAVLYDDYFCFVVRDQGYLRFDYKRLILENPQLNEI